MFEPAATLAHTDQMFLDDKMRAFSLLSTGIAPDFTNLLTVILGYCNVLMDRVPDTGTKDGIVNIRRAGERMAFITKGLMEFSSGNDSRPQIVDINGVIEDLEHLYIRAIEQDINLVLDLSPSAGLVNAAPARLAKALMNLIENACESMPEGGLLRVETAGVTVPDTATAELDLPAGEYVRVTLSDSGTGISDEIRSRIFDPFFSTKTGHEKTGLGLTIAYWIVEQNGGAINLSSEEGNGTTAQVYLPRAGC